MDVVSGTISYFHVRLWTRDGTLMYERQVTVGEQLTLDSGMCTARQWFETPAGLEGPLRERCPAYIRSITAPWHGDGR